MKTYKKGLLVALLLLSILSIPTYATNISIMTAHQVVYIGCDNINMVVATSAVLGDTARSLARSNECNPSLGGWVIPNTAKKDDNVVYWYKSSVNGKLYQLSSVMPRSDDTNITNVTKNSNGTVSYRYKGFAKAVPSVLFDENEWLLKVNFGTNYAYDTMAGIHIPVWAIDRLEWRLAGSNPERYATIYRTAPYIDSQGNLTASFDVPIGTFGVLVVVTKHDPAKYYQFSGSGWISKRVVPVFYIPTQIPLK